MTLNHLFRSSIVFAALVVTVSCSPDSHVAEEGTGAPTRAHVDSTLAECFENATRAAEAEDWRAASEAYEIGLSLEPNVPALRIYAARNEIRLGNEEACRSHLEAAIRLGATTDLAADEVYADALDQPGFRDLARQLLTNGEPLAEAEVVHRFTDTELWPEGIAVDADTGDLYVGSIGRRAIYRVSPDGRVEEFGASSEDGLMEVLGIWVDSRRRTLWAVTGLGEYDEPLNGPPRKNELVRYDLETGRLENRYEAPDDELRLLNDVVVGPDGTAWATETLRGELFRVLPDGELEVFRRYPELFYLNGIAISDDGRSLYLGHYGGLSMVATDDGSIESIRGPDMTLGMVDGLSRIDGGLVMVQNSRHVNFRVVRVGLEDDGRAADALEVLQCGLPDGLIPYTCAVHDGSVFVIAGADFGLMDQDEPPPAPAVVRLALDP
jgi:SMP-30/Gluconolactonase/LRE-like region